MTRDPLLDQYEVRAARAAIVALRKEVADLRRELRLAMARIDKAAPLAAGGAERDAARARFAAVRDALAGYETAHYERGNNVDCSCYLCVEARDALEATREAK